MGVEAPAWPSGATVPKQERRLQPLVLVDISALLHIIKIISPTKRGSVMLVGLQFGRAPWESQADGMKRIWFLYLNGS